MKYKKEILFMLGGGIFGNLSGKAMDYNNINKINNNIFIFQINR